MAALAAIGGLPDTIADRAVSLSAPTPAPAAAVSGNDVTAGGAALVGDGAWRWPVEPGPLSGPHYCSNQASHRVMESGLGNSTIEK